MARSTTHSIFTRDTIASGRFNLLVLAAVALTLVATMIEMLNRILGTIPMNATQWEVGLLAVIALVILSELVKPIVRRVSREGRW